MKKLVIFESKSKLLEYIPNAKFEYHIPTKLSVESCGAVAVSRHYTEDSSSGMWKMNFYDLYVSDEFYVWLQMSNHVLIEIHNRITLVLDELKGSARQ